MEITVLGPGCVKCRGLEHRVRKAVIELALDARVVKMEDVMEIVRLGVMQTPALMIDKQLVMSGTLPTYTEIKSLLKNFKNQDEID